jgi:hypothetical protein
MPGALWFMMQDQPDASFFGLHQRVMIGIERTDQGRHRHTRRRGRAHVHHEPAPTGKEPEGVMVRTDSRFHTHRCGRTSISSDGARMFSNALTAPSPMNASPQETQNLDPVNGPQRWSLAPKLRKVYGVFTPYSEWGFQTVPPPALPVWNKRSANGTIHCSDISIQATLAINAPTSHPVTAFLIESRCGAVVNVTL